MLQNRPGNRSGEQWGYGVADLLCDADHGLAIRKGKRVGEGLKASRLPDSDRAIGYGVKVASLLGFEEFCSDCERWPVPPEPTENVSGTHSLPSPALGNEMP